MLFSVIHSCCWRLHTQSKKQLYPTGACWAKKLGYLCDCTRRPTVSQQAVWWQLQSISGTRGRVCRPQTALLQLCYDWHVLEFCRVVVKHLHQSVSLLSLGAVEELHLVSQTLSLLDGLWRWGTDVEALNTHQVWHTTSAASLYLWISQEHKTSEVYSYRLVCGLTMNLGSISAVMSTMPFSSFRSG